MQGKESDKKKDAGNVSGQLLGSYVFDLEALRVLRTVEARVEAQRLSALSCEEMLLVLAASGTGDKRLPDCERLDQELAGLGWPELKDAFDLKGQPDPYSKEGGRLPLTVKLDEALDRARNLARSVSGSDEVAVRHLLAALLIVPAGAVTRRLLSGGVNVPRLRSDLADLFTRRHVRDDGGQWRLQLVVPAPTGQVQFDADRADKGKDQLDVERYALAFATLMSSWQVKPPLSIGVFGDWGAGKSFFMRLMREQTRAVCALPELGPAGATPARSRAEEESRPELLAMADKERAFMLALAGAIGKSSRRLKRFVNTYRLLKASTDAAERETFVLDGGAGGEYRAAMTLLAMITGAPLSALGFFRYLEGLGDDDTLADQRASLLGQVRPGEQANLTGALDIYSGSVGEQSTLRDLRYWGPESPGSASARGGGSTPLQEFRWVDR